MGAAAHALLTERLAPAENAEKVLEIYRELHRESGEARSGDEPPLSSGTERGSRDE